MREGAELLYEEIWESDGKRKRQDAAIQRLPTGSPSKQAAVLIDAAAVGTPRVPARRAVAAAHACAHMPHNYKHESRQPVLNILRSI